MNPTLYNLSESRVGSRNFKRAALFYDHRQLTYNYRKGNVFHHSEGNVEAATSLVRAGAVELFLLSIM